MAGKAVWVKKYMADHGCSKQAAYKAFDKSQPASQPMAESQPEKSTSQPKSKPSQPESTSVELQADIANLYAELLTLHQRIDVLEKPRGVVVETRKGIHLGASSWGKSDKLIPR